MKGNFIAKTGILMKKYLTYIMTAFAAAAFFIFSVPVTVLAVNEAEITEMAAQGEITSDVNVRKGPSTDYEKIGTVREGDIVTVTGQSHDGWYRIEYQGAEGFIYGQYMTVISTVSEEPEHTAAVEEQQEEAEGSGEEGVRFDFGVLKAAAAVVIIAVIIVMIFLTLRSMRQAEEDMEDDDDDEEDEDDEDDDGDEDDEDDDDYDDGGEDDDDADEENEKERALGKGKGRKTQTGKKKPEEEQPVKVETVKVDPKTIVIREEDYQLHIDPKYFEDEPIAQPDCVTGYLQKKQEEEEQKKNRENSGDLQKAMDKLQELQEEIEKLKKNQ